jgi:hypothetical protein
MFEIGEKVKVKSYEKLKEEYGLNICGNISVGGEEFIDEMEKYCNQEVTIKENWADNYGIEEDNDTFWWSQGMFIPIQP